MSYVSGFLPAGLMQGPKRAQDQAAGPVNKVARTDGEGGGWICEQCGNHNYEGRLVCNMRSCGAPRDSEALPVSKIEGEGGGWTCERCGNHNYEGRVVCNMRSCGAPRDPVSPSAAPGKGVALKGPAAEGWMCDKCGNHNFEGRIYCNMRSCGNPGPWNCPACGNRNYAGRKVCNMKKCNQPMPPPPPGAGPHAVGGTPIGPQPQAVQAATAVQAIAMLQASGLTAIPGVAEGIQKIMASGAVGAAVSPSVAAMGCAVPVSKGAAEVKEGSWVCVDCGNINFPTREVCNARLCGKPRAEVDGGPPAPGADSKTRLKPGSWVCSACSNINWPEREACGMRKCGLPRSQVDAGPPPME